MKLAGMSLTWRCRSTERSGPVCWRRELKCVERLNNAHKKQLLTYLRQADKKLGYLLNFGEALMQQGIVRIVNRLSEHPD